MNIENQIKITRLCEALLRAFIKRTDLAHVYTSHGLTLMSVDEAMTLVEELKESTVELLKDQVKTLEWDHDALEYSLSRREEGNE